MNTHDLSEITRQSMLKALSYLNSGDAPKGFGNSIKFDLVNEGRHYPPKAVLAKAYEIEFEGLELANDFTGGSETKCFEILRKLKFTIVEKPSQEAEWALIAQEINAFTVDHITAKKDKTKFSEMHVRLKSIGERIQKIIDSAGYYSINVKTSIGQGEYNDVPWIGFFDHRITNGASKGHYPVILFEANLRYFYVSYAISNGEKRLNPEKAIELKTTITREIQSAKNLSTDKIVLNSETNTSKGYEIGVVGSKNFSLPIDDPNTLRQTIFEALSVHHELALKTKSKTSSFPNTLKMNINNRLITSLASKPFVILAGGTGTGKTKCAIEVARKVCLKQPIGEAADYEVVAVGADWTDTRPLLGYENILGASPSYTVPKALDLIIRASRNPERPFFLILDEMNLSHVERYFSDFLSIMESKKIDTEASTIKLHANKDGMPSTDGNVGGKVEQRIQWPDNLFVIGTVNIDETTHMFSPKVLDRAHVIEFKPDEGQITDGLKGSWGKTAQTEANDELKKENEKGIWAEALSGMLFKENRIMKLRKSVDIFNDKENDKKIIEKRIMDTWRTLSKTRFSFSHRTAQETAEYIFISHRLLEENTATLGAPPALNDLIDLAFLQKILPKINGSAETLSVKPDKKDPKAATKETTLLDVLISEFKKDVELTLCIQKLEEMKTTLEREHFVSFIQ